MRIRGGSFKLFVVMVFFASLAAIFLATIGHDALNDQHPFQFFADSNTYHRVHSGDLPLLDGARIGIASNYVGPLLMLDLVAGNIYLVMALNSAIFLTSVVHLARPLRLRPLRLAMLLMLSPLTISSLLSVNKEIFIFPFFAFALAAHLRSSLPLALLALGASVLVRWQLTGFYLLLLALVWIRPMASRRTVFIGLLAGSSVVYAALQPWLEPVIAFAEFGIAEYEGGGSGLFETLLQWQKQGAYILAFPLKAAQMLFALGLKFDRIVAPVNIYNDLFVALHCLMTLVVFATVLRQRRFKLGNDLIYVSIIFLAVFCISPVFAPRYLYPVFLLWLLVAMGAPAQLPRPRSRLRSSRPPALRSTKLRMSQ